MQKRWYFIVVWLGSHNAESPNVTTAGWCWRWRRRWCVYSHTTAAVRTAIEHFYYSLWIILLEAICLFCSRYRHHAVNLFIFSSLTLFSSPPLFWKMFINWFPELFHLLFLLILPLSRSLSLFSYLRMFPVSSVFQIWLRSTASVRLLLLGGFPPVPISLLFSFPAFPSINPSLLMHIFLYSCGTFFCR